MVFFLRLIMTLNTFAQAASAGSNQAVSEAMCGDLSFDEFYSSPLDQHNVDSLRLTTDK